MFSSFKCIALILVAVSATVTVPAEVQNCSALKKSSLKWCKDQRKKAFESDSKGRKKAKKAYKLCKKHVKDAHKVCLEKKCHKQGKEFKPQYLCPSGAEAGEEACNYDCSYCSSGNTIYNSFLLTYCYDGLGEDRKQVPCCTDKDGKGVPCCYDGVGRIVPCAGSDALNAAAKCPVNPDDTSFDWTGTFNPYGITITGWELDLSTLDTTRALRGN